MYAERVLASGSIALVDDTGLVVSITKLADLDDYEDMVPTCSICDGVGHGYPGAGPCPLEMRGEEGVPWWAQ